MANSSFIPCAIIPVYNHGGTTGAVVRALVDAGLPVLLVDDASNSQTKAQLAAVVEEFTTARLFTLPENLGKGGAVSHGLLKAFDLGYTNALQVDADGQHDLSNIKEYLDLAREHPELLVAGRPVYDESVPLGRKIGRKITNFWVSVETLSRDIPDAMCGFRVYPVPACAALFQRKKLGTRMEFDIEVLVRLHWAGTRMKFLPVKVVYPVDGISHFNMLKDNIAISKMHTILFFGMLLRLPLFMVRTIRSWFRRR